MTTVFIISAPSGSGKSTLVSRLLQRDTSLMFSVSYTTRPPRGNEVDGLSYKFVSRETLLQMKERGEFLECAEVFGLRYMRGQRGVGNELFLAGKAAQIRTIFAEDHFHRFHPDGIDLGTIYAAHPEQSLAYGLLSAAFDLPGLVRILQRGRLLPARLLLFHLAQLPQNLVVVVRHPLLDRLIHLQCLAQTE